MKTAKYLHFHISSSMWCLAALHIHFLSSYGKEKANQLIEINLSEDGKQFNLRSINFNDDVGSTSSRKCAL